MSTRALARWDALHLDVLDPVGMAGFLSVAIGGTPREDDGLVVVAPGTQAGGATAGEVVLRMHRVEIPQTVKHRVHLDVEAGDGSALLQAGARVVREPGDDRTWTVLTDPEGGELCLFTRPGLVGRPGRLYEVVVDAADPIAQARWWAGVFGVEPWVSDDGTYAAVPGPGVLPFASLSFVPVPERRSAPNRLQWSVRPTGEGAAELLAHGASDLGVVRERSTAGPDTEPLRTQVLADPEGNEFRLATDPVS